MIVHSFAETGQAREYDRALAIHERHQDGPDSSVSDDDPRPADEFDQAREGDIVDTHGAARSYRRWPVLDDEFFTTCDPIQFSKESVERRTRRPCGDENHLPPSTFPTYRGLRREPVKSGHCA